MSYDHFKSEANKLNKLHLQYNDMQIKFAELGKIKNSYYMKNEGNLSDLKLKGGLCLIALLIDLVINNAAFDWISTFYNTPVFISAIAIMIIDTLLATAKAGTFAKTEIGKDTAKKIWRIVMWGFGIMKIVAVIAYIQVVKFGEIDGSAILLGVQIFFIVFVYTILDLAGEGIYHIFQWIKFSFLENIWYENPNIIITKINKSYSNVKQKCIKYKNDYSELLSIYELPGKINYIGKED